MQCSGGFEQWISIHAEKSEHPKTHPGCGGPVVLSIEKVNTYGVGNPGAQTRTIDQREKNLALDRDAYKRLRDDGHQPRHLSGAHKMEATAKNEWYIRDRWSRRCP